MRASVHVVGGGLAGCECAYQLAQHGLGVVLHEMRPAKTTAAHQTSDLAELVCSNSLRSDDPHHASGLLKREMERLDSLIVRCARAAAVPAGSALAVDREIFARGVTAALEHHPAIDIRRTELREIPDGEVVIATGPLTSDAMSSQLQELLGSEALYFYDAISPIVEASSLDMKVLFAASRYGKGGDDYLNSALDEAQYQEFVGALLAAEVVELHAFEETLFFEGCLPVEELARRGRETLRFGPMKPVGLTAPGGLRPHAVVQLRRENIAQTQFSLVGFQSRLKWGEQRRVLRTIPGLEEARFVRLGQVHRNTFVNSPAHLDALLRVRQEPRIRLAGQLTGVEGYLESAATGLLAGLYLGIGENAAPVPLTSALGALTRHLIESDPNHFQPANINYGLFPPLAVRVRKRERRAAYAERALADLEPWASRNSAARKSSRSINEVRPVPGETTGPPVRI